MKSYTINRIFGAALGDTQILTTHTASEPFDLYGETFYMAHPMKLDAIGDWVEDGRNWIVLHGCGLAIPGFAKGLTKHQTKAAAIAKMTDLGEEKVRESVRKGNLTLASVAAGKGVPTFKTAKPKPIQRYTRTAPFKVALCEVEEGGIGICTNCGTYSDDYCEPDASERHCHECGENTVYGLEEAVLMGSAEIADFEDDDE